jgi:PGF-pre-PGF domain-containing protein
MSWNTKRTGSYTAKLVVIYNGKIATKSINFVLPDPYSPSSGGGGGGGGGGGLVSEGLICSKYIYETREMYLEANFSIPYNFSTPDLRIYEVLINPVKSLGLTEVKVSKCLSKNNDIPSPQDIVYSYFDIMTTARELQNEDNINDAAIKFKVDKNWLSRNSLDNSSIRLFNWDGNAWNLLETDLDSQDEKYVNYTAITKTFGAFAISIVPAQPPRAIEISELNQSIEAPDSAETPLPKIQPKTTEWGYPGGTLAIIGILAIGLRIARRKLK